MQRYAFNPKRQLDFGKKADFTEKNAFFFGFIGYKEIEKNEKKQNSGSRLQMFT